MAQFMFEGRDAKGKLMEYLQKFLGRPVTKEDISYVVTKIGDQHQAIVKLICIDGQEVAGHPVASTKDAEKSAAFEAIQVYMEHFAALPESGKKKKASGAKRPASENAAAAPPAKMAKMMEAFQAFSPGAAFSAPQASEPRSDAKSQLHQACGKIAKRSLVKGEVVYECHQTEGGFQAVCKLLCLPPELLPDGGTEEQAWAGEVTPSKQAAEQSAAAICLESLLSDPAIAELAGPAKQKKASGKGAGKAGKGDFDMDEMYNMMWSFMESQGWGGEDYGETSPDMAGSAGAKAGGGGAASSEESPKQQLNVISGKVAGRPLAKGEVEYTVNQTDGGFQATVTLHALPGEWASKVWAGDVAKSKALAETNAAAQALETIRTTPELMASITQPSKPQGKGKGKSKGKGKGKGGGGHSKGGGKRDQGVFPANFSLPEGFGDA